MVSRFNDYIPALVQTAHTGTTSAGQWPQNPFWERRIQKDLVLKLSGIVVKGFNWWSFYMTIKTVNDLDSGLLCSFFYCSVHLLIVHFRVVSCSYKVSEGAR